MGIVKQRSGGGERSTAPIAVAGLALVQALTVPFSLFYQPSGPADSGRSRPLQGARLPDDDKAHDESRLRLLFGLRIKSFSLR